MNGSVLTIVDNKEVDPKDCKAFSNRVVCILEDSLHNRCVYLNNDDTSQARQYHSKDMLAARNWEFC